MSASRRSLPTTRHYRFLFTIVAWGGLGCGGQGEPSDGAGGGGQLTDAAGSGGNGSTPGIGRTGAFEHCELVQAQLIQTGPEEPMTSIVRARLDADGYMDAVATRMACCADGSEVQRKIFLFTGGADGKLNLLTTLEIDEPPVTVALADLNGDTLDDVLALTPSRAVPFINDGSAVFARKASVDATTLLGGPASENYDFSFIGARDYKQDGATDLAFYTRLRNDPSLPEQVHVLPGDGLGGFAAPVTTELLSTGGALPPAPASAESDLIVGSRALVSRGDGTFDVTQPPAAPEPAPIDINGDGSLDRWDQSDDGLRLYLGDDEIIPAEPTLVFDVPEITRTFFREDSNGDGVWDITAITQPDRSHNPTAAYVLSVLFGRGDGTFEGPWSRRLSFYSAAIFFADVGEDGRRELIMSGLGGTGHVGHQAFTVDCSEP